ncbi:MAG: single-stranded-DNA-specific exonuclease [Myxococcota bacterium]|jgi:single-stranded-DNA-specific exonuclease
MRRKVWHVRSPDPAAVAALSSELRITNVVAGLLVNRGLAKAEEARVFLEPRLKNLLHPDSIDGMAAGVERILTALEGGEKITVYGDYDVDGMTASSTLFRFLEMCGHTVEVFLPDRFADGYGVNADRVRDLVEAGTKLFITVDCGITATKQVTLANELGADFIIVDHHQLPLGPLPPAVAIINPHQPTCAFPFKDLCAAGLAFYLTLALRAEMRKRGWFEDKPVPDVRPLLDIVAIGTIADVVPLRGLNRILVSTGLPRLRQSPHPGVRALAAVAAPGREINSGTVAFQLGPRLNAAGRLSTPMKGFELLTTPSPQIAREIAQDIDEENKRRRTVQETIEKEALEQATRDIGEEAPAYVLWSADWHPGVTGIVASRVVERFHRPCAMIAIKDGVAKGSIRSISGFNVLEGLRACSDLLTQFGGHAHAAGITLPEESLPAFREAFSKAAREMTPEDRLNPRLLLDAAVGFDDVDSALLDAMDALAPFGAGNPEPRLCTYGADVLHMKLVGADKTHVKLVLQHNGRKFPAIAFGRHEDAPQPGDSLDVAYRPEYNEWQGTVSVQLRVLDFRPAVGPSANQPPIGG